MTRNSLRPALLCLGALAALGTAGCRTSGSGGLARQNTLPPVASQPTAAELLADHNRNARKVVSLDAKPTISGRANRHLMPSLNGRMAMERPRKFKLVLEGPGGSGTQADIGSNDNEFWFWVKKEDQAVYFCRYDDQGESPLPSTLQPDFIMEALGLRPVPKADLDRMAVIAGKVPGELVLSVRQKAAQGADVIKELVVSEKTRQVRQYTIRSADRKAVLAHAVINEYNFHTLPGAEPGTKDATVYLPRRMRIEWAQEKLSLDIAMSDVQVNPPFDETRRAALFVEPEGFERKDLAALNGIVAGSRTGRDDAPRGATNTRETMPAPAPRVRLAEPLPLGNRPEGDAPRRVASADPLDRLRPVESVVAPPIPTINDPAPGYVQAHSGWRTDVGTVLER